MRVTAGVKASSIRPRKRAGPSHPDQCDLTARAIANATGATWVGKRTGLITWGHHQVAP